jgi:hypothetical protein
MSLRHGAMPRWSTRHEIACCPLLGKSIKDQRSGGSLKRPRITVVDALASLGCGS